MSGSKFDLTPVTAFEAEGNPSALCERDAIPWPIVASSYPVDVVDLAKDLAFDFSTPDTGTKPSDSLSRLQAAQIARRFEHVLSKCFAVFELHSRKSTPIVEKHIFESGASQASSLRGSATGTSITGSDKATLLDNNLESDSPTSRPSPPNPFSKFLHNLEFNQPKAPQSIPKSIKYTVKTDNELEEDDKLGLALKFDGEMRRIGLGADGFTPHIQNCEATVVICDLECDEEKTKIGYITAKFIRVGTWMDDGRNPSLVDQTDEDSYELFAMYNSLFDSEGGLKTFQPWDERNQGDILYIDNIQLDPEYRGFGIGLLVIDAFIKSFPSFEGDRVIIWPFVPHPEALKRNLNLSQHKAANKRLEKYYEKLGFEVWSSPGSKEGPFMGLWTGFGRPDIEDVVPHLFDYA